MASTCAIPGCTAEIPPDRMMCHKHWLKVPRPIQIKVWNAWRARSANNPANAAYRAGMDEYSYQRERAIMAVEIAEKLAARRQSKTA
jgi:hypothetical protein